MASQNEENSLKKNWLEHYRLFIEKKGDDLTDENINFHLTTELLVEETEELLGLAGTMELKWLDSFLPDENPKFFEFIEYVAGKIT